MAHHSSSPRLALLVTAGALAFTLGACSAPQTSGASSTPTPSSTADPSATVAQAHADADVEFAQGMIVHHRGALEMAEVASTRAQDPRVQELAARVTRAQGPEIDEMTSWLQAWGEDVPSGGGGTGGMAGMDGAGGDHAAGMMSDEEMGRLRSASGRTFDETWLRGMTAHHRGALEMSRTEIAQGRSPETVALAKSIISDQEAEIAEMEQVLGG